MLQGFVDAGLGEAGAFDTEVVAGPPFHEDEEAAAFASGRVDGVHLPVAELLALTPGLFVGNIVDAVAFFTRLCNHAL